MVQTEAAGENVKQMMRQVTAEEQQASCGWLTNSTSQYKWDLV